MAIDMALERQNDSTGVDKISDAIDAIQRAETKSDELFYMSIVLKIFAFLITNSSGWLSSAISSGYARGVHQSQNDDDKNIFLALTLLDDLDSCAKNTPSKIIDIVDYSTFADSDDGALLLILRDKNWDKLQHLNPDHFESPFTLILYSCAYFQAYPNHHTLHELAYLITHKNIVDTPLFTIVLNIVMNFALRLPREESFYNYIVNYIRQFDFIYFDTAFVSILNALKPTTQVLHSKPTTPTPTSTLMRPVGLERLANLALKQVT